MASTPPFFNGGQPQTGYQVSQQQTMPTPVVFVPLPSTPTPMPPFLPISSIPPLAPDASLLLPVTVKPERTGKLKRLIPLVIALALLVAIVVIWFSPPYTAASSPGASITQPSGSSSTQTSTPTSGGTIRVYIVGAVKHPGVYTLAADARVYDLVQAAGGPQGKADLVTLNMAAKLTDGEEVYVTLVGEIPPTYLGGVPGPGGGSGTPTGTNSGQLVNINTATADEMRQSLHVSSTTAQNIVNYRVQHGPYTSVDQLLQVVSKSIYDKIKSQVTV